MKTLWLLKLIRTIVDHICVTKTLEIEDPKVPAPSAAELNHHFIAEQIRDILAKANINNN